MRTETVTTTYNIYKFEELNEEAKENVRQMLLNDYVRDNEFYEHCKIYLKQHFPRSDLKPHYRLSSCQGDGFNTEGTVNLYDALEAIKEKFSEKEIRLLESYFERTDPNFTFETNHRYGYSCKFVDKKYIHDYVQDILYDIVDDLDTSETKKAAELLKKFYIEMLDYFEDLDRKFEKDGYQYLYEISDEEVQEICDANDYEFFEDGTKY